MKKLIALLLAALMLLSAATVLAEALPFFGELTTEDLEYDPNPEYEKYTLIEYYIEGADATVIATVSGKIDNSEFCLEFSFYGDDQKVICNREGEVSFDKTGFMAGDTPAMMAYAMENGIWFAIPSEDDVLVFGDMTSEDAEYDPDPEYDKYSVFEYYIEGADATVVVTISAKADESEFNLEFSFYGDDQKVVCNREGEVSFDKTGFMAGDTPAMMAFLLENAVWAERNKANAALCVCAGIAPRRSRQACRVSAKEAELSGKALIQPFSQRFFSRGGKQHGRIASTASAA